MAAILHVAGITAAYRMLAAAALRGRVTSADRDKIEAEALRQIAEVKQAKDEFAFSVADALRQAERSLRRTFINAKAQ